MGITQVRFPCPPNIHLVANLLNLGVGYRPCRWAKLLRGDIPRLFDRHFTGSTGARFEWIRLSAKAGDGEGGNAQERDH